MAAEVLTEYLDEPGVRDALEYASADDEAEEVRDHARYLLLPETEQRRLRRAQVLDESLPDATRFAALQSLTGADRLAGGKVEDVEDDVAFSAIEMALESPDPRIRSQIWSFLPGVHERYAVDFLLQQLANDPSESVREAAAQHLRTRVNEPSVRDALQYARNNDPSAAVRSQAASMLETERN